MHKRFAFSILLVIVLSLLLSACGGDKLTAKQVEDAFNAFIKGDVKPINDITCDAEQVKAEDNPFTAMGDDADIKISCERKDDVMSCNMEFTVAGQTTSTPTEIKIKDEKLCGNS